MKDRVVKKMLFLEIDKKITEEYCKKVRCAINEIKESLHTPEFKIELNRLKERYERVS